MQRLCTKVYITCVKWEALKWKTNIMNKKSANKHLYKKRLFWGVCYRLLLMHGQLPVSGYVTTEKISSDKMPFNTRTQSDLNLFWHVIDQHIGLSVKEREKKS